MKRKTDARVLAVFTLSLLGGAATAGCAQNAAAQNAAAQNAAAQNAAAQNAAAPNDAENIALGKSVTFSVAPNYDLSTDADDAKQITDGQYSERGPNGEAIPANSMWMQKAAVGWSAARPIITIDLGKVQPISGVSYDTSAGRAGVEWPTTLPIAVSDDAEKLALRRRSCRTFREAATVRRRSDFQIYDQRFAHQRPLRRDWRRQSVVYFRR